MEKNRAINWGKSKVQLGSKGPQVIPTKVQNIRKTLFQVRGIMSQYSINTLHGWTEPEKAY